MAVSKHASRTKSGPMPMPSVLTAFSDLIANFYESPLKAEPSWQECLEGVRDFFSANYAVSIFRAPTIGSYSKSTYKNHPQISYSGVRNIPDLNTFYNDNYYALDPFVNLPLDRAFTVQESVGETHWTENAFYKQFLAPMDVYHVVAVDMQAADGVDCRIRICRPQSAPEFSDMEKEFLEHLVQHMKRSVQLHTKQREAQSTNMLLSDVIDRLMFGSIILDQFGSVLHMNEIAAQTLNSKDGLALSNGKVHALLESENTVFQKMVTDVLPANASEAPDGAQTLSISRPNGENPLGVMVRRLTTDYSWLKGERVAAVAVLFRDPMCMVETSYAALRQLFSFTPAEAGLAMLLAEGLTMDEAATTLNVSRNTARTHLKSMFLKTGTTRQADLIRMILGSVATIS